MCGLCGSKASIKEPSKPPSSSTSSSSKVIQASTSSLDFNQSLNNKARQSSSSYLNYSSTSKSSASSSLSCLKDSLPETPNIYDFSELCLSTRNFLSKRFSSSAWRCVLRGKDVVLFQRKLRRPIEVHDLRQRLSVICRTHHTSLVKLHGACLSDNYVYLVYEYVNGAHLSTCLRNPKNAEFTVLSSWLSRMQVATDIAHGLDYIHHCSGLKSNFVHNHIKSSSVIVTEGSLTAKICHFGTAYLTGELAEEDDEEEERNGGERTGSGRVGRAGSRQVKFEGTRGFMAPEFQATGVATQKMDVYAFGIVMLELFSGQEVFQYKFDVESGEYRRVSVIDTARNAVNCEGDVRRWVDGRLKDSFPIDVAEKMVKMAIECVEDDPDRRPDIGKVAARVSKLFLESSNWAEKLGIPTDFTVSMAPR